MATKTFKLKGGKTLDFETFPIKDANFRKIRIHRDGSDGEGLWAAFSDEGVKLYDDDKVSTNTPALPVILVNSALNFYPHNSWGLYIPVKLMGGNRPECNLNEMEGDLIFCQERLDGEAKEKAKTAKPKKATKAKAKKCKCGHC